VDSIQNSKIMVRDRKMSLVYGYAHHWRGLIKPRDKKIGIIKEGKISKIKFDTVWWLLRTVLL
jgi:hypothetical protein